MKKKKLVKNKIWVAVDKDDGEILEFAKRKGDLNIWEDAMYLELELKYKI